MDSFSFKDAKGARLRRVSKLRKCNAFCFMAIWSFVLVSATSVHAQGCDPNYSPCVPVARDVDCAGGSGNGPAYVEGPVSVIGSDIYDLDRDGDGIGCE
ncbi:hypothetical protein GCM10007315_03780 [Gemmobacter tilapiae]|uniref:Excalibur calcium-binding domain-containing protein n=1 Tax=Neogemmobacter tilapiae TaxID=875041 RepID=A0A918TF32_9RHOB|nr:hypothetical protein GCM10007315_03780 [Gemmobacter tilapiae]